MPRTRASGLFPPRGAAWTVIDRDSNPASATYRDPGGTVSQAATIPTTGRYVTGHLVRSTNPATGVFGWLRRTTGNAHVAGVDWQVLGLGDVETYTTRAELVSAVAAGFVARAGSLVFDGRSLYRGVVGSTLIADLGGLEPFGTHTLEHWGVTTSLTKTGATTDFTTQVQAAMTGTQGELLFTGWVKITDKVTLPAACNPRMGPGRARAGLVARTDFNLSATAVLEVASGEPGPLITSLGMWFEQPAAPANRGELIAYPPALDMSTAPRTKINELRIEAAIDGLRINGNAGGSSFGSLELGCFGNNVFVNGPADFVKSESIRVWPFGIASNAFYTAIFYDGTTRAIVLQDCDGWDCSKFSSFRAAVEIEKSVDGLIPYKFGNLSLDGDGARLLQKQGGTQIGNVYSSKSTAPTAASIDVTGGRLMIGNLSLGGGEAVGIDVTGGLCQINGGEIFINSTSKIGARVSAGTLVLGDTVRLRWSGGALSAALVQQSGTGILRSNAYVSSGMTASTVMTVGTDVAGNMINGAVLKPHSVTLPAVALANGVYRTRDLAGNLTMTLVTPGDLSVTYGVREIRWALDQGFGVLHWRSQFTPTFTTGTGNIVLTVAGFPALRDISEISVQNHSGLTLTGGRTQVFLRVTAAGTFQLLEFGPGIASRQMDHTNLTSGTQVTLLLTGAFYA
jgi:hypothetical protein